MNDTFNQTVETGKIWRFDPVDTTQMRLLANLPSGRRVWVMLEAQALARGMIKSRLRRQYPHASNRELGLKLLEEVSRDRQIPTCFNIEAQNLGRETAAFWVAAKAAAHQESTRLSNQK